MRTRKKQLLFVFCLFLTLACSCVYAYRTEETVLRGSLRTEKVEIELDTKDAQEKNARPVMAGQTIRYQPEIRAKGSACYVRLTADIRVKEAEPEATPALPRLKQNKGWVKKGTCFYYTKPLKRGETVSPFTEIQVPGAWDARISGLIPFPLLSAAMRPGAAWKSSRISRSPAVSTALRRKQNLIPLSTAETILLKCQQTICLRRFRRCLPETKFPLLWT